MGRSYVDKDLLLQEKRIAQDAKRHDGTPIEEPPDSTVRMHHPSMNAYGYRDVEGGGAQCTHDRGMAVDQRVTSNDDTRHH